MKKYLVKIEYSVEIEAESAEKALDIAESEAPHNGMSTYFEELSDEANKEIGFVV